MASVAWRRNDYQQEKRVDQNAMYKEVQHERTYQLCIPSCHTGRYGQNITITPINGEKPEDETTFSLNLSYGKLWC